MTDIETIRENLLDYEKYVEEKIKSLKRKRKPILVRKYDIKEKIKILEKLLEKFNPPLTVFDRNNIYGIEKRISKVNDEIYTCDQKYTRIDWNIEELEERLEEEKVATQKKIEKFKGDYPILAWLGNE